jgi:CubicO group peptidase (beta-lactamase class C family)/D-alanyl-D-alanine dipeptidase
MRNFSAAGNFRIVMRAIWILVLAAVPTAMCVAQGPPDAATVAAADGYGGVVAALEPFIQRELAEKDIPALSIALVDDQRIVWARGFGVANAKDSAKATAATIYRVGSVSKLFTDIGVMHLVERGQLDLDVPISRYLAEFAPHDPFTGPPPVTLRELMTHRAGLPLESPVGSYVDSTTPTLAATVASLNEAALVYRPGSHTKYSNASAATAGYAIERTQGVPFAQWMDREILTPLGLRHSGFGLTSDMVPQLAAGTMWTYEGRRFPAPTFPIGESPAIGLYSSVTDLSRFISALFAWGRGPHGPVVAPASLAEMWRPQYDTTVEGVRYGLGFEISSLDGHRRIGHSGSVYGFATDVALLPEDRLGVVVICTLDGTGPVATRISDTALRLMLAHRAGRALETPADLAAVPPQTAARLEGWYHSGTRGIYLETQEGVLYARSARGGQRLALRAVANDTLITDDRLGFGNRVLPLGFALIVDRDTLWRAEIPQPTPVSSSWAGLIGEYGWEYNSLNILERGGRLMALVDWFQEYPLTQVGKIDTYQFPEWGLYDGEQITFERDANGKAIWADIGGVRYDRRLLGPEDGTQFHITPVRPIEELRRAALAAQPPAESGSFNPTDLVDVTSLDSTIKLDIRYATANNFLGVPVYTEAKAYLQRPAAEALVRVNRALRRQGYGLLIHDAYRPWHVTKLFWDATPPEGKIFVADPQQGSNHNRGSAVDLTLFDTTSGKEVQMTGGYDEMSDRSYAYYPGGTSLERWRRDFLRRLMEQQGYHVYEAEWWHFDFGEPKKYRIGNIDFEHLAIARR